MLKNKKIIISMAAAILISCKIYGNDVYAAEPSQMQSEDVSAISEGDEANADTTAQEISGIGVSSSESDAQGADGSSSEAVDSDEDEPSVETPDQITGEQQEETSGQDEDGQLIDTTAQDISQKQESNGLQDTNGQPEEEQEVAEDDDEWADGDNEWTDAWTGADDDIDGGNWEEDEKSADDAGMTAVGNEDVYSGGEAYIAENSTSNISSNEYYAGVDQNYQTGAGLGDDIFLIAAAICGITAIVLAVRKCKHKN